MAYEFYLGIDVPGEERPVTISLVEKTAKDEDAEPSYRVHRLEQIDRGDDSADKIADRVQNLIADAPYTGRTMVVVSKSDGRGEEITAGLSRRGLSPLGVVLTGGDTAAQTGTGIRVSGGDAAGTDEGGLNVSEHEVVECVERLYRSGRLSLQEARAEEESSLLAQGLQSYEARSARAGVALNDLSAEARRDAEHTGFVLSTGAACWLAEEHSFDPTDHLNGPPPPVGPAKREMRSDTTDYLERVHEEAKGRR